MKITEKDLIVSAEKVSSGERVKGYVCCCKICRTPLDNEKYDKTRPIGRLTSTDGSFGGVRVYTDNMEFVNFGEN